MKNKESIKKVYDEIHAPDALFGKVMEMNKKESKIRNILKYSAGTAAALALTAIATNGICYAATGETWVSKAIVYINGETSEQEITWHQNGDMVYGELEVPVTDEEGTPVEVFSFESSSELPDEMYITADDNYVQDDSTGTTYSQDAFTAELKQKDGKIFLVTDGTSIDITEDFQDGKATGTFEYSGLTIKYTVTGSIEDCDIKLSCE